MPKPAPRRALFSWSHAVRAAIIGRSLGIGFILAALLSLNIGLLEASNLLGGLIREPRTNHTEPSRVRQLGAAQENHASGLPAEPGNIRWAERFPGNDLGAQINEADSDLGKDAGEIRVGRPVTHVPGVILLDFNNRIDIRKN